MKIIKNLVICLMVFTLSACSTAPLKTNEQANEDIVETANYPVTITDHLNRQVEFSEKPARIVSGYYITSSLLIALGLEDSLVGIEAKAKSRPIYSLAAPQFLELPNVGTAKEFDLEGCLALEPDLVILPIKLKDSIEILEEMGIKVIGVNPEDETLSHEVIQMISQATATTDRAEALMNYIEEKQEMMKTLTKDLPKKQVYFAGNSSVLSTAGAKMYQNTMMEQANAINVANAITDNYWAEIDYEQLLAWQPEVIIIAPMASYTVEELINDEQIQMLDAMRNQQVFTMPSTLEAWDSPVPSSILGSLWLVSVLYPESYSTEAFNKDVSDFYKTFYDLDENIVQ